MGSFQSELYSKEQRKGTIILYECRYFLWKILFLFVIMSANLLKMQEIWQCGLFRFT